MVDIVSSKAPNLRVVSEWIVLLWTCIIQIFSWNIYFIINALFLLWFLVNNRVVQKRCNLNESVMELCLSCFNSLAPGKFESKFRHVIFKQILVIDGWGISCEIVLIWMPLDFIDDQSTLVQVMAWCHQATSHYLSQCWPRSLLPYGITRPQWVNPLTTTTWNRRRDFVSIVASDALLIM